MEILNRRNVQRKKSSDIQLERLEFAANGVATWTPWCSAASMFADEDVHAFLAQATDAFRACVAVSEIRQLTASGTVDLNRIRESR